MTLFLRRNKRSPVDRVTRQRVQLIHTSREPVCVFRHVLVPNDAHTHTHSHTHTRSSYAIYTAAHQGSVILLDLQWQAPILCMDVQAEYVEHGDHTEFPLSDMATMRPEY